jgi:hypothetical protein
MHMGKNMRRTNHAVQRQAQRNLSDADVWFVLEHGRRIYGAGVLHVFLGQRDIPDDKETQRQFRRLEGTVLVMNQDDEDDTLVLITAYRNRRGLKQIRSKAKYTRAAA